MICNSSRHTRARGSNLAQHLFAYTGFFILFFIFFLPKMAFTFFKYWENILKKYFVNIKLYESKMPVSIKGVVGTCTPSFASVHRL